MYNSKPSKFNAYKQEAPVNIDNHEEDFSNVFIDPAKHSSEAIELANQFNGPEEYSIYFSAGQPRGNPSNFDVYMNLSFTYSRYFTGRNRYMRSNSWKSRSYYKPKSFQKAKSNTFILKMSCGFLNCLLTL